MFVASLSALSTAYTAEKYNLEPVHLGYLSTAQSFVSLGVQGFAVAQVQEPMSLPSLLFACGAWSGKAPHLTPPDTCILLSVPQIVASLGLRVECSRSPKLTHGRPLCDI